MPDINFLSQRQITLTKVEKKDRVWFRYSVIFFIVVLLIFLAVTSINLFLQYRFNQVQARQNDIKRTISSDEQTELAFLTFANKLTILGELFEVRSNKQAAINYFDNLLGDDVFIKDMNFEENGQILTFNLVSADVFKLEETFTKLNQATLEEEYQKVSKNNIKRNDDGSYGLELTITLGSQTN